MNKDNHEAQPVPPVYDTLSEGFVRLVQIKQKSMTKGIECRTEQFHLAYPPSYIALSYACGSRPADFSVNLNGRDWRVRKNLFRFLRQRLQMDRDPQEWLWIDAICIDQANLTERGHQVRLMANIYGKASRVLTWLGPAYEQSEDAMRGLLRLQSHEKSLETAPWILALVGFCSRQYWHRLWVLQELKLARQKDLMCGSKIASWQCFETLMLRIKERSNELPSTTLSRRVLYICNSAAMCMIALTSTPAGTSLWDLLNMSAHLQCEERRDRVYALCGLATAEAASIDVDYNVPMPVLLNRMLAFHIDQISEISIQHVTSICFRLEGLFGTPPGTIFELHNPTYHLHERPGLMYQRLRTRSIDTPGLTLLWTIHHEHVRVQELIKVAHRLQTPSPFHIFCGFMVVGLIATLYLVFEDLYLVIVRESGSPLTHALRPFANIVRATSVTMPLIGTCVWYRTNRRLRETDHQADHDGKWRAVHIWPDDTALDHHSIWKYPWWIPFIVSEIAIYIAAQAFRPLKLWSLGYYFRGRHGHHEERGHNGFISQNNGEHSWN